MARRERRKSRRRRSEDRAQDVLLIASPQVAGEVEDSLTRLVSRQGRTLRTVSNGTAAERLLADMGAELLVVEERSSTRATVSLLRRLREAEPGAGRIVLVRRASPDSLVDYVNAGQAHYLLRVPWNPQRLAKAVREVQLRQKLGGGDRDVRVALAELHDLMAAREQELSETNQQLRKALREIGRKNRALTTLNASLRIQSTTDALTGLYNRREFLTRIRTEWGRYRRYSRPLSLIMLDIDHFKQINDTYGHECGDTVLAELGQLIRRNKRAQDLTCRYGGEEFVVVLPETTLDAAFHVAEDLRRRIAEHSFTYDRQLLAVRVSLGVAGAAEQTPRDVEGFINLADKAMYRAKREGRNRTVVLDAADESRIAQQSPESAPRGKR